MKASKNLINSFNNIVNSINQNKFMITISLIMLNIGSKYIDLNLTKGQELLIKSVSREILIFSVLTMPFPYHLKYEDTENASVTGDYILEKVELHLASIGGPRVCPALVTDNASPMKNCWEKLVSKDKCVLIYHVD